MLGWFSFALVSAGGICYPPRPALSGAVLRQRKISFVVVHATAVQLVNLGAFANGQALHEPLLEVVPVLRQHCFQGVVQKLQVLFQFGEVASGDGGEPLFLCAETVFAPVEVVVLAEILGVCVVGGGLLVLTGVIFFVRLPPVPFAHRPTEALILQAFDGGLRYLHVHQPLVLGLPLPVHLHECTEEFFAGGVVPGNIRERIGGSDDRLLAGIGVGGQRDYIDHLAVVPPVVPGADPPARHRCPPILFLTSV